MPRYVDIPTSYVYQKKEKKWSPCQCGCSIGRVHTVNPLAGDVFYLRILLHSDHCRGKTSFDDMMTIDARKFDSYQDVCRELCLLNDDEEWSSILTDAAQNYF